MTEYQDWFNKAKEDLETANFNKENNKNSYAAFLYQQAVEKAIKAYLMNQNKGILRSHDCYVLAKKANLPKELIKKSDLISAYYFRTRYPDSGLIKIDNEEIEELFNSAKEVIKWIEKNL